MSGREGIYNLCSGKPISVRRLVEERTKERAANIKLPGFTHILAMSQAFWGIRDVGETLYLHTLPNAPLKETDKSRIICPRVNTRLVLLKTKRSTTVD